MRKKFYVTDFHIGTQENPTGPGGGTSKPVGLKDEPAWKAQVEINLSVGIKPEIIVGIEGLPPFLLTLKPIGEPCKHGFLPPGALSWLGDDVVFSINLNVGNGPPQYAKRCVHLKALCGRHVCIDCTMKQQQRSVYLVGVEEWRLVDV